MRKHTGVALTFALFLPRWRDTDGKMLPGQSRVREAHGNIVKILPVPILMFQDE
jgi:hypothetical protein